MTSSGEVWVAGEALIDLIPQNGITVPVVGGGAANTACALAKLRVPTRFIGGISSDEYGELISEEMKSVDLRFAHRSNRPTATARVSVNELGVAIYSFELEATATFDFKNSWLPNGKPALLHVGTLATIVKPGADQLFAWASNLGTPIIYDPNVRPAFLEDRRDYRESVEKWANIATVVKLSDEDLCWLGYEDASRFFELGAQLVILTRGKDGLTAMGRDFEVSVAGIEVDVIDTVGAGDTVGAVIAKGLFEYGLNGLIDNLKSILNQACLAAAITCSRLGANSPSLEELERFEVKSRSFK